MLLAIHVIDAKENEFYTISVSTELKDLYRYDVCLFEILIGTERRFLNLKVLPDLSDQAIPLYTWLGSRDYSGFETVSSKDIVTEKTVKYSNLNNILNLLTPTNVDESIKNKRPIEQCKDIAFTSGEDSIAFFKENTLVSVNGYFHRTVANSKWVYLLGANSTYIRSGYLEIDVMDFSNLGGIEFLNVSEESVFNISGDSCYYKLDRPVTTGITPFVVILGQLHVLTENSKNVKLVSDDVIKIDIDNIGERILRALADGIIRPSDIDLSEGEHGVYLTEELLSEETFRKVMGLDISFSGFINKSVVRMRKRKLENIANSNLAEISVRRNNPLFNSTGQLINHVYSKDGESIHFSTKCISEIYRLDDSTWKQNKLVQLRKQPIDRYDDEHIYEYFIHGE